MGHQAAQCTVGTVNWRAMYGENAFVMRPTLFHSDIEAAKKAKQIDFEELEKSARAYAKARREGTLPDAAYHGAAPSAAGAAAAPAAQPPPPQASPSDLLPGWAAAQDAAGKTYYWHKETKAVQWNKPLAVPADVAPDGAVAAAGGGGEAAAPPAETAAADTAAPME
jgi:hypothetical protein